MIASFSLIGISLLILFFIKRGYRFKLTGIEWSAGILASLVILTSFVLETHKVLASQSPENFPWGIFITGEILGILGFIRLLKKGDVPKRNPL
ncbi:MAG: hypothetical protein WBC02_12760 [Candidatus Aminicenantaceae bacterium]